MNGIIGGIVDDFVDSLWVRGIAYEPPRRLLRQIEGVVENIKTPLFVMSFIWWGSLGRATLCLWFAWPKRRQVGGSLAGFPISAERLEENPEPAVFGR